MKLYSYETYFEKILMTNIYTNGNRNRSSHFYGGFSLFIFYILETKWHRFLRTITITNCSIQPLLNNNNKKLRQLSAIRVPHIDILLHRNNCKESIIKLEKV